jgi:hypothetical protein
MTNKYIKKFSASLAIKEMQIKVTLRLHLTPQFKWLSSIAQTKTNYCEDMGEKGTLLHYW